MVAKYSRTKTVLFHYPDKEGVRMNYYVSYVSNFVLDHKSLIKSLFMFVNIFLQLQKNLRLIQLYLYVSYFSLLVSLPTTFMAIAYANVNSMARARDLCWTVFWLASIHRLIKGWRKKSLERDEEIEEILE